MRKLVLSLLLSVATVAGAQVSSNPCPKALPVPAQLHLPALLPPGEPVAVEKQLLAYFSTGDNRSNTPDKERIDNLDRLLDNRKSIPDSSQR